MSRLDAGSMFMCSIFVNSKIFRNVDTAKVGDFFHAVGTRFDLAIYHRLFSGFLSSSLSPLVYGWRKDIKARNM